VGTACGHRGGRPGGHPPSEERPGLTSPTAGQSPGLGRSWSPPSPSGREGGARPVLAPQGLPGTGAAGSWGERGAPGDGAAAGVTGAAPGAWGKGVEGRPGLGRLWAGSKGGFALKTPSVKDTKPLRCRSYFIILFYFILLLWCWDLNSGPSPRASPPALFVEGFFEIGSHGTICPGWL
jgi:hypothetical protein